MLLSVRIRSLLTRGLLFVIALAVTVSPLPSAILAPTIVEAAASAQQRDLQGQLTGRVTDAATKSGVESAQILVAAVNRGWLSAGQTTWQGHYSMRLPAGVYTITATRGGYYASRGTVRIQPAKRTKLNLVLQPGERLQAGTPPRQAAQSNPTSPHTSQPQVAGPVPANPAPPSSPPSSGPSRSFGGGGGSSAQSTPSSSPRPAPPVTGGADDDSDQGALPPDPVPPSPDPVPPSPDPVPPPPAPVPPPPAPVPPPPLPPPPSASRTVSPPITARRGQVIRRVKITSTTGPCIIVSNVADVWIDDVELGPCAGNGVRITGSGATNIRVTNSVIHTERRGPSNSGVGVFISGSSDILIQGNRLSFNESSVYAFGATNIRVIGNYSHNPLGPFPRGQHVMFNSVTGGEISDNYGQTDLATVPRSSGTCRTGLHPCQEDAINLYGASQIYVLRNYMIGGDSASGCGVILDGGPSPNDNVIEDNIFVRTGHCGIGAGAGQRNVIRRNMVLDPNIGSGSIGLQIINFTSFPCAGLVIAGNVISNRRTDGTNNDLYNSSTRGCSGVTMTGNVFGNAARVLLLPVSEKLPPPPIPPKPYIP